MRSFGFGVSEVLSYVGLYGMLDVARVSNLFVKPESLTEGHPQINSQTTPFCLRRQRLWVGLMHKETTLEMTAISGQHGFLQGSGIQSWLPQAMASLLCQNNHRFPSEVLCAARDGTGERARRQMQVTRVTGIAVKGISSCKLRSESDLSGRVYCVAKGDRDARQRGVQSRLRIYINWSFTPRKVCSGVGSGSHVAPRVGDGMDAPVSRNELLRPDLLDLQSDGSTTGEPYYGATSCHLNFWFKSFCYALLAIGLSFSQTLGSEARSDCNDVAPYYAPVHGIEGLELKTRLHDIIKDHDVLSYIQVWDALKLLDEAADDPTSVVEIYSLMKVAKSLQASTDGWNREHLWPRSYGLTMGRPEFTDLQNLRASDVNVNSSRGNKFFGDCTESLSNKCIVPANKEAAPDTGTNKDIWMPPAQVRGDISRVLMYMAVRYGIDQPAGSPELQLSDSPSIENAQMGRLSDLLHWNETDPPSDAEKLRNNRICSLYQHNRNPFVDHPEYAKSIWGVATVSAQKPHIAQGSMVEKNDAWINEFHYDNEGDDQDEFVEVVVGPKVNALSLTVVLYNGGDGKVYGTLPLRDVTVFSRAEDIGMGFTLLVAKLPSGSIQNGPRDALALVQENSTTHSVNVLQFLSYEGTLKALDGPAQGLQSVDIMVKEGSKTPPGSSLGLTGSGEVYNEFQWSEFRSGASPGTWNLGQILRAAFRQLRSKLAIN